MSDYESNSQSTGFSLEDTLGLVRRRKGTVIVTAIVVFVTTVFWVGTQTPVYRASATVLIDPESGQNGLLSELASLGKAPPAASEIAIIGSRSIAERVVALPPGAKLAHPGVPGFDRHLGLSTTVEDESMRPLATLWSRLFGMPRSDGRLYAQIAGRGPGAPNSVRVNFIGENRVRFSNPGFLANFGVGANSKTVRYKPGKEYDYEGLKLHLHSDGDVSGRNFSIYGTSESDAARALTGNTRVIETERNSGVVRVTVNDSDPLRAARTADALCLNYFDLNIDRGSKRASQTVSFIEERLRDQKALLDSAEGEVARLQQSHPETINVSSTATSLIERLSELEVERVHLSISHTALKEALALIREGDITALSRLSVEGADLISRSYVEQFSLLTAEFEMQDRSDTGPYKLLKQTRLEALQTQFDELESQAASFEHIIETYKKGDESVLAGLPGSPVQGYYAGPLAVSYMDRISVLETERADLAQIYKPEFPRLVEIDSAIDELRKQIIAQLTGRLNSLQQSKAEYERMLADTRSIIDGHPEEEREKIQVALNNLRKRTLAHIQARYEGVGARRDSLNEQIMVVEERLGELPAHERELAGPMRRLQARAEIVKFLLKSQQDAEIARAATIATAEFIDPAQPPVLRYTPRVSFTLMMGSILGLVLGVGLAYLRESLKGSIHTEADLESVSGLPVLGAIPDFRALLSTYKGACDFVALRDAPDSPVAEAYRSLRANLRFALGGEREIQTLAVTSCTPGEGKSVTNADLAIAFAAGNKRVLLVDADLRKPRVHKNFPIERSPGVAEVLMDGIDWRSCVQDSEIENLDILSAGVHRGKPGDLMAQHDFGSFVEDLKASYDVIVFDLPPALVVADVENLAHKLDALLLLYRSDGVAREAVRAAAARMRQTGCNLVGTVLNAVRPEHGKGGSYYHSYYEYTEEKEPVFRKGA